MSKMRLDSSFFNYIDDRYFIFSYFILRYAFKMVVARAMGHLNGRTLEEVARLRRTDKKCRKCGNNADVKLTFKYNDKYYSIYLCKEHYLEQIHEAKEKMIASIENLTNKLEKVVGP
ncbi:MAG: hypothetical protein QXM76_01450 [Zestosphaera sp.]